MMTLSYRTFFVGGVFNKFWLPSPPQFLVKLFVIVNHTRVLVADDVHKHSRRRMHDHEVPVKFADLPHIGEHVPSTTYASGCHRDYQHAVRNKSMEH